MQRGALLGHHLVPRRQRLPVRLQVNAVRAGVADDVLRPQRRQALACAIQWVHGQPLGRRAQRHVTLHPLHQDRRFGGAGARRLTAAALGRKLHQSFVSVPSVPVISFAVPKAGDFIDAQAAAVTGELATRIRVQKESNFAVNGLTADLVQNALNVYYDDVILTLANSLRSTISSTQRLPKLDQSVPIVLSGGTAIPKGFLKRFTTALRAEDFPIKISEIRVSEDPLHSTARGALMAALC